MATDAVITKRMVSARGRERVETGTFTYSTDDDILIRTSLNRVEFFKPTASSGLGSPAAVWFYNSLAGTDNEAGGGGVVFLSDTTPQLANGVTYTYEAVGV